MVTHSPWYSPVYSQWLPVAEVTLVLTLELGLDGQIPKPASHTVIKHVISVQSQLSNPDKTVA
jgi:predicted nucleic acid binding AN1-type Zn finger protein